MVFLSGFRHFNFFYLIMPWTVTTGWRPTVQLIYLVVEPIQGHFCFDFIKTGWQLYMILFAAVTTMNIFIKAFKTICEQHFDEPEHIEVLAAFLPRYPVPPFSEEAFESAKVMRSEPQDP